MIAPELIEVFSRQEFLRELHHLMWISPQFNNGAHDEGWNCRDHALVVAGIAQMLGFKAFVMFGRAAFVQGTTATTAPIGAGISPHSWVGVEQGGEYDLSVRLATMDQFPQWKDWGVSGLFAGRIIPSAAARVYHVDSAQAYENAISAATNAASLNTAIYYCEEYQPLSGDVIRRGLDFCNSLLTNWLHNEFGGRQDLHAHAIAHLFDRLRGKGESLTSLTREDAWRNLASRRGDAVWRVCSRGNIV